MIQYEEPQSREGDVKQASAQKVHEKGARTALPTVGYRAEYKEEKSSVSAPSMDQHEQS